MASIAATRQAIVDALNTVSGLVIRTARVKNPRINDGWVIVNNLTPSSYSMTECACQFTAVIILGPDEVTAESRMEALAVPVLNAVTKTPTLQPDGVVLEPVLITVGEISPAPLYALTLTLSQEVD